MTDGQLEVKLVPDEQALEEVEKKQLEISGEADSVQESKKINEEQNTKLGAISRSLFSMLKKFAVVIAILAPIIIILQSLADIFDISFQDIRSAIVKTFNDLINTMKDVFTADASGLTKTGKDTPVTSIFGLPGQIVGEAANVPTFGDVTGNSQGNQNVDVNVMTSRDQLTGDSTQQEQQTSGFTETLNNAGSGDIFQ